MFLGFYMLDGKEHFNIYYKCREGYEAWHRDTFSPTCEDIATLDFKIGGKTKVFNFIVERKYFGRSQRYE